MSYILDALVKADRERQRQGVPGLHTVQSGLPVVPAFRRRWPVGVGAATLAVGLAALAWSRLGSVPAIVPASGQAPPMAPAPASPPAPAPAIAALPSRSPPPIREALPRRTDRSAEAKPARPGNRLHNIAELPPDLQEQARRIRVAGFARGGDSQERQAIINDRAWREGDEVTTGLRVERISDDGVIFNLKGYRFRKGAA